MTPPQLRAGLLQLVANALSLRVVPVAQPTAREEKAGAGADAAEEKDDDPVGSEWPGLEERTEKVSANPRQLRQLVEALGAAHDDLVGLRQMEVLREGQSTAGEAGSHQQLQDSGALSHIGASMTAVNAAVVALDWVLKEAAGVQAEGLESSLNSAVRHIRSTAQQLQGLLQGVGR